MEENTKVIFNYDGEEDFLELTPEQMRLLIYLKDNDYLIYDLSVTEDPVYRKI